MSDEHSSFESLAERFTDELRTGGRPSVSEFAQAHPEFAEQIHRLFPVLELMEGQGTPVDDLSEEGLLEAEMKQLKSLPPLRRLGDYRIVREVGRGGMGIVFEAQQESLGRKVALKLLPESAHLDQRRLARFEQEARASAMLHHTNIVPIFGVGSHGDTSYFVMQFIDGEPLNSVLKELSRLRKLPSNLHAQSTQANAVAASTIATSLNDSNAWAESAPDSSSDPLEKSSSDISATISQSGTRGNPENAYWRNVARIGTQVANALDHAHNKRILHRDIKPSNLMIDQSGCAWVTDFGLAKYDESPDLTRTGEVVGTLRYMSPEQLNGQSDERSDIFGLGLTLYEMAALRPAYDATDRSQLMKQVLDASPPSLRNVDRRIPRDLETIVQKCTASDPHRRYAQASDVAEDLQRFLAGEPVHARRINPLQRAAKWCRRRPAIATLMTALLVSLLCGIAGVAWQWHKTADALALANSNLRESNRQTSIANRQRSRALKQTMLANRQRAVALIQRNKANQQTAITQEHFKQARESVDRFFTAVSQQRLLKEPGLQPLRKELLQEALNYHQQFVTQYNDDDELRFELGVSHYYIAEIESLMSGSPQLADSLDEPLAIFQELSDSDESNPYPRLWLARTLGMKSNMLARFDSKTALQLAKESIDHLEQLREDFPEENLGLDELARQYQMVGLAYESLDRATQRTDRALSYYTKSYGIRLQVYNDHPDDVEHGVFLADINRDLGITYRRMGEYDRASEHYDRAIEILTPLVESHPNHMLARRTLASISVTVGFFYGTGAKDKDYDKALAYYKIAEDNYADLSTRNPMIIEYQDGLARAISNAGGVQQYLGNVDEALDYRQRAEKIRAKLCLLNPKAVFLHSGWAVSLNGVGSALRSVGRFQESIETHQRAHEVHMETLKLDPRQTVIRLRLVDGIIQLARTHAASLDFQKSIDAIQSIDEFLLPNFSRSHYLKGLEYTINANKIGHWQEEDESPDQDKADLKQLCIDRAKESFQTAFDMGYPVLRESRVEAAFHPTQPRAENQLLRKWLEDQFGTPK